MKKIKHKLPKFIDINTYDYSWFVREMTEVELYKVNGGIKMEKDYQHHPKNQLRLVRIV